MNIHFALSEGWQGCSYIQKGDDYADLDWKDAETAKPTEEEINKKIAELAAVNPLKLLRAERDRLIAATDWWVLPDRTPSQVQLDYRQALRDITETYTSLDDVVWPEKP